MDFPLDKTNVSVKVRNQCQTTGSLKKAIGSLALLVSDGSYKQSISRDFLKTFDKIFVETTVRESLSISPVA